MNAFGAAVFQIGVC